MTTTIRVQDRNTGAKGDLLNADRQDTAEVAMVKFDSLPYPTWAEWKDLAW